MAKGIPVISRAAHLGIFALIWSGLCLPLRALEAQRGALLPFGLAAYGCGIWIWFYSGSEPQAYDYIYAFIIGTAGLWLGVAGPHILRIPGGFVFAVAFGFGCAGLRGWWVEAPQLNFRYYGAIEGRVIEIDRSASDAVRITLDRVVLERMAPDRTPARVRVSVHENPSLGLPPFVPKAGQTVILTGHLASPEPPVEPGGFDFRKMAYFDGLGAVGYTRLPVLVLRPPGTFEQIMGKIRAHLSAGIRAHIPGEAGAFAAGAMTGDRSGISQATVVALRDSSLAHILAISGMNLAVLVSFTFGLLRGAIALWPWLALRVNSRKMAATASLGVAYFYLLLSGGNVATERAFYMVVIMMGAIMLDRRAISMRTAALAGIVLLSLQPESLLEPGFQMSFAATIALISGFEVLSKAWPHQGFGFPVWAQGMLKGAIGIVASAVLGGVATAPFAALHFNRFAEYGLLANLLVVPAIGIAIMPMGVVAFLLAPLGLAFIPLFIMGLASKWILFIAYEIAALDGAVLGLASPGSWALALVCGGGFWLMAWPSRGRLFGCLAIIAGAYLWGGASRPEVLISPDGRLVGLLSGQGRAVSDAKAGGFAARNWLENDGDLVEQAESFARAGFGGPKHAREFEYAGLKAIALSGKAGAAMVEQACETYDLVIIATAYEPKNVATPCYLLDRALLSSFGGLAISRAADGRILLSTSAGQGRPWQPKGADYGRLRAALPPQITLIQD